MDPKAPRAASANRVASPPAKPLMIFDGDCGFCRRWIERWRFLTGDRVDYLPYQDPGIADGFPEIPRDAFKQAVHLVEPDGRVTRAAEAVFRGLAHGPGRTWPLWAYEHVPGVRPLTEATYRTIARHRTAAGKVTSLLWGPHLGPHRDALTASVFVRLLAIVYFVAFMSLETQIVGLVGRRGVLPAGEFLDAVRDLAVRGEIGPIARFFVLPTLCWLNASDPFLRLLCGGGAALALLLCIGVAPTALLTVLWILYLSLSTICRDFLSFQWDVLLLETGLLSIFLLPPRLWLSWSRTDAPSRGVHLLLLWLLFRLMFSSGVVKLESGDPNWRNLHALTFHYETQPLPSWIGWYARQLPLGAHRASAAGMFFVELVVPFFVFGPRRLRFVAFWAFLALQTVINVTGNYGFFGLQAAALCVVLLDDAALVVAARLFRPVRAEPVEARTSDEAGSGRTFEDSSAAWPRWILAPVIWTLAIASTIELADTLRIPVDRATPIWAFRRVIVPFRSVNGYGLFAVMTTTRPEIIIEGSSDGDRWQPYEFKYKPGDPRRPPGFVAPHQPRLDWQMWFAALGQWQQHEWFPRLCARLLEGSPDVLALLAYNPFPARPPRYIRAVVYDYRFTDRETRSARGAWWRREPKGLYMPIVSLGETRQTAGCVGCLRFTRCVGC